MLTYGSQTWMWLTNRNDLLLGGSLRKKNVRPRKEFLVVVFGFLHRLYGHRDILKSKK